MQFMLLLFPHILLRLQMRIQLIGDPPHRRRNWGGGGGGMGGMFPPSFHELLYKLLTTLYVVSNCAPLPIKSFLRHCTIEQFHTEIIQNFGI